MLMRLFAAVLLVSLASPAAALEGCFAESTGGWRGPVLNGPGLQTMDAEFQIDTQDRLVGRYHVHDVVPFDGALTDFQQTGACEADFFWHDRYGSGVVHIRFEPEKGRFLGYWGRDQPNPALIFDGFRIRPPAVS